MREPLTNADLSDVGNPDEGPVYEPRLLHIFGDEESARCAVNHLERCRKWMSGEQRFGWVLRGREVQVVASPEDRTPHALLVLYLQGQLSGERKMARVATGE